MPKFRSAGSISFGGIEYKPNEDGEVIVPMAAKDDLLAHGLTLISNTDDDIPMPPEAESAFINITAQRDALQRQVAELKDQNLLLVQTNRAYRDRVDELEGLNGPGTDDPSNTDPMAPKFGAMTLDQLRAFIDDQGLNAPDVPYAIDIVAFGKGSIPVKRSLVKKAYEAKQATQPATVG